jgi:2-polyprenyl-3-methyl-5-hydroxy-6-metoxy-1,4-benzoquinol methylase
MKKILEEKFNTKFDGKIDPFQYFFGNVINTITTEDNNDQYAVHNFNGGNSMSYPPSADIMVKYILENYSGKNHIDIGGSRGYLSRRLIDQGLNSFCLDGWTYGINNNMLDIDMSKYVVCDMVSGPFNDLNFEKFFDVSTAFEITEHIHEKDIKLFYDNVSYMSKEHICSIHTGGVDSTMGYITNHHNVKSKEWWINLLKDYGQVIEMPELKPSSGWDESEFLKVIFK